MEERREGKGRREQPLASASERTGVISERIRLLRLGSRCHDNLESLSNTARSTLATRAHCWRLTGAANVTRQGRKSVPAEDASRSEGETAEESDRSQEAFWAEGHRLD